MHLYMSYLTRALYIEIMSFKFAKKLTATLIEMDFKLYVTTLVGIIVLLIVRLRTALLKLKSK